MQLREECSIIRVRYAMLAVVCGINVCKISCAIHKRQLWKVSREKQTLLHAKKTSVVTALELQV